MGDVKNYEGKYVAANAADHNGLLYVSHGKTWGVGNGHTTWPIFTGIHDYHNIPLAYSGVDTAVWVRGGDLDDLVAQDNLSLPISSKSSAPASNADASVAAPQSVAAPSVSSVDATAVPATTTGVPKLVIVIGVLALGGIIFFVVRHFRKKKG